MTLRPRVLAAALALSLTVSACATVDGSEALLGDELWELADGGIDGIPVPRPAEGRITLQRTADGVGGTAACNQYFAVGTVRGDAIAFEQLGQTEMACEPPLMDAERRYLEALARVTTGARQGGDLVLTGPGVELRFVLRAPVDAAALVGTVWLLDGLVDGDAVASVSSDVTEAELTLEQGGVLRASTGCRMLLGRYELDGDEVVVPELAAEGACSPELQSMDDHVVAVLGDRFRVTVDGARLSVRSSGGLGLEYRVQDAVDG